MKQGTIIVRIIVAVLFLGVLAYFGVYLWNTLTTDSGTATLYTYTAEESVSATGYFFRDETILSQRSDQAETVVSDGEKVGAGDVVARIYTSAEGYRHQQELDVAQETLANLQYIQSRANSSSTAAALDEDIVAAFTSLRADAASGDLSGLSNTSTELKSLIFRRDFATSGNDTLAQQIAEVEAQIQALSSGFDPYSNVTAPSAGTFSSVVDGFEGVMTVEALEDLNPAGLAALAGKQAETTGAIGKLITSSGWYFACNLGADETGKLYRGAKVTLRFDDVARDFSAAVRSVSDEENGVVTVVFYSRDYAAQVCSMRCQNVQIITGRATGLRVPKRAIRINEEGVLGLYRVSGAQAEYIPVKILWEEEDFYLVVQADKLDEDGNVVERSAFEKASLLREGDTVVVKGEALYDGKVVTN